MPRVASVVLTHAVMTMIAVSALTGCSQSERGEFVFTRQNQVASALATVIMESESRGSQATDRLYDAETQLDEACAALRQAASLKMRGNPVGFDSEFKVLISLDHCAAETRRIERLVWRNNPEVARFYLGTAPVALQTP